MSDNQAQLSFFQSDGLKLAYRRFGHPGKTPLLFLHGIIYSSYDWIAMATELAGDREVVALDQRGFGNSDWSLSQQYAVQDFADDAARLIEHMGWKECIVVGHSMGGRNATGVAVRHPQLVAGLVLADSPPVNSSRGARRVGDQLAGTPKLFKTVEDALRYFPKTPWRDKFDPSRRKRFEDFLKPVPGGYATKRDPYFHQIFFKLKLSWPYHDYGQETWPMGQEFDTWAAWEKLTCPTLVIAARAGDFFSPESIARTTQIAREKNPNIELLERYYHHNLLRVPEEFTADIRKLTGRLDRDSKR